MDRTASTPAYNRLKSKIRHIDGQFRYISELQQGTQHHDSTSLYICKVEW